MSRVFTPASLCLLACVFLFASAVWAADDSDGTPPPFCHELDCPKFKVVNKTDAYELREYPAATWVSTKLESRLLDIAEPTMFMRLFNYISGENKDAVKINMTCPVRVRIIPGSAFGKTNFTMSFFVPFEYQSKSSDGAPKPTNPDVFIDPAPATRVYVAQFSGFAISPIIAAKAKTLTDTLAAEGVNVEQDYYFFAGYDSPAKLTGRHNEVWLVAPLEQQHGEEQQATAVQQ